MSRHVMHALALTVTHECLDQVALRYHPVEEDNPDFPGATTTIDRPPSGKIGFYLYYFEAGMCLPPSLFFG